jgi:hypothetical protein
VAHPTVRIQSTSRSKGTAHEIDAKWSWWLISKSEP